MKLRSEPHRWGDLVQLFHWVMALAIIGNGIFGLLMDVARSPMQKLNWLALHKSIGLTVLALLLLRLLWRLSERAPLDEPAPRWQQHAAHAMHVTLYVMMAAIPLTGWWFNSLAGKPLQWFKQFNVPALAGKDIAQSHFAHAVHEYLFWLLLLLLVAHVGAALKHHWQDRDNVLLRMLPFTRLRKSSTTAGDL